MSPIKTVECHFAFFFMRGEEVQPNNYIYKYAKFHLHIQIIHLLGIDVGYTLNIHNYNHLMITWTSGYKFMKTIESF